MRYPTKIAKALNESSIPSPKGIKWTKNVIVNVLSNEKYCGDAILKKSFVVDFIFHTTKKERGRIATVLRKKRPPPSNHKKSHLGRNPND